MQTAAPVCKVEGFFLLVGVTGGSVLDYGLMAVKSTEENIRKAGKLTVFLNH